MTHLLNFIAHSEEKWSEVKKREKGGGGGAETDRHTDKQTDRQTDRQTDGHKERDFSDRLT